MARPEKTGLDYFSVPVDLHDAEQLVEVMHEFGNLGLGMLCRLCGRLYKEWGWFHPWTERDQKRAAAKMGEPLPAILRLVECLLSDGYFDQGVFDRHQVLTSADIQKNFYRAVEKRTNVRVFAAYWLLKPGEFSSRIVVVPGLPGEETPPDGRREALPVPESTVQVDLSAPESTCIKSNETKSNRERAHESNLVSSPGNSGCEVLTGDGYQPVTEYAAGVTIRRSTYERLLKQFGLKPTDLIEQMQRVSLHLANAPTRPSDMDAYVESWLFKAKDFAASKGATVHPFTPPGGSSRADAEFAAVMDVVREYRGPRFEEARDRLSGEARKTASVIGWHVLASTNRNDDSMRKRFAKTYGQVLTRHDEPARAEG